VDIWLSLMLIAVFDGIAIFFIVRVFIIALSFRKGEVPYVPIGKKDMKVAVAALKLQQKDRFLDIGSGDGRVVLYVAKLYPDINCTGIEKNKLLVLWSRFLAWILRRKNAIFFVEDATKFDYNGYNKIFMYLTLDLIVQIMPRLKKILKSGARVVSCKFGFGALINKGDFEDIGKDGTQLWVK